MRLGLDGQVSTISPEQVQQEQVQLLGAGGLGGADEQAVVGMGARGATLAADSRTVVAPIRRAAASPRTTLGSVHWS